MPISDAEVLHLARQLNERDFGEVAKALRASTPRILTEWRRKSLELMPDLDRLTILEFEDSIGTILNALAAAMECRDPERIGAIIRESPAHGAARFQQHVTPSAMLAEERILRTVVVDVLRRDMGRRLSDAEALSIHELLDVIGQYSVQQLIALRGEARDAQVVDSITGLHRLADMGLMVAGLAHDAANLMLPLRSRMEGLAQETLSESGREDVEGMLLIMRQLQHFIANLRMLTVEGKQGAQAPLDLPAWWAQVEPFYRRMIRPEVHLVAEFPPDLPGPRISVAALSQVFFNLVRNAEQALREEPAGEIRISASRAGDAMVEIIVEDNGSGMSPDILARCSEPFFSSHAGGSGLGLAIVDSLLHAAGGSARVRSPRARGRGVSVHLTIPSA